MALRVNLPIRHRLTLLYCLVLGLSFVAFFYICDLGFRSSIEKTVDDASTANLEIVRRLLNSAAQQGKDHVAAELRDLSPLWANGAVLEVADGDGNWLFRSVRFPHAEPPLQDGSREQTTFFTTNLDQSQYRIAMAVVESSGQRFQVHVGVPTEPFDQALDNFRAIEKEALPLLVVLASLLGYWLSGKALQPVNRIIGTAEQIGARNLSLRLEVPAARDELRRLTETLNAMLARIEDSFRKITQFTADASHDLRTPVTVIRSTAEVALRRQRQPEEYRDALGRILETSEQTSELLENLLQLARSDAGVVELEMRPVDLNQHVRKAREQGAALAGEKALSITLETPPVPVLVLADEIAIHRLLLILIDNAVKYTPAGGRCEISLTQNEQHAHIAVKDDGIGIAEADLGAIFERFRRADRARSRETPGAGLGLAIARWITEIHGGTIRAESVLGSGSVFHVSLPVSLECRGLNPSNSMTSPPS
jgi:two-component system, OmpR family, heavy metal sensor histidine kinase CusS